MIQYLIIQTKKFGGGHEIAIIQDEAFHLTPGRGYVREPMSRAINNKKYREIKRGVLFQPFYQVLNRFEILKANRNYCLLTNNCEHFTKELLGQTPESPQVNSLFIKLGSAFFVIAAIVLVEKAKAEKA